MLSDSPVYGHSPSGCRAGCLSFSSSVFHSVFLSFVFNSSLSGIGISVNEDSETMALHTQRNGRFCSVL